MPLDERREAVLGMSEERRCYEFCQMIETGYNMDVDAISMRRKDYRTLRDLLECPDKSDCTPDQKWQLQWVFTHPKEEEYIMSELGYDVGKNPKGRILMPGIVSTYSFSFYGSSLQREEDGELLLGKD